MAQPRGDFFQHRQVEINDVPTRQHVGIESRDAGAECVQCRGLIDTPRRAVRHRAVAPIDNEDLVGLGRVERNGQQALALAVGLDVEGQHARLDPHVGGPEDGVVEYPGQAAGPGYRCAFDFAAALDSTLD